MGVGEMALTAFTPNAFHLPTSSLIFVGDARHISISNPRGGSIFVLSLYLPVLLTVMFLR